MWDVIKTILMIGGGGFICFLIWCWWEDKKSKEEEAQAKERKEKQRIEEIQAKNRRERQRKEEANRERIRRNKIEHERAENEKFLIDSLMADLKDFDKKWLILSNAFKSFITDNGIFFEEDIKDLINSYEILRTKIVAKIYGQKFYSGMPELVREVEDVIAEREKVLIDMNVVMNSKLFDATNNDIWEFFGFKTKPTYDELTRRYSKMKREIAKGILDIEIMKLNQKYEEAKEGL